MSKGRLEAFSDGVIAILITIMVLGMKEPQGADLVSLAPVLPTLVSYILSFVFLGIYWSNHHHLFQAVDRVNGTILWANLHLLFWLSLIPFATSWIDQTAFAVLPVALYGVVLLLAAFAYFILVRVLLSLHGNDSLLATALGSDLKGKLSLLLYLLAIPLAFLNSWVAYGVYVLVAVIWLVPDPRIEKTMSK